VWRRRGLLRRLRFGHVETRGRDVRVDTPLELREELVARGEARLEPLGEPHDLAVGAGDPADELDAAAREPAGVAVVPPVVSRHRRVARQAGCRGGERLERVVHPSRLDEPVHQLPPAVDAGEPRTAADGQDDVSPGVDELVRDLTAGLAASDDEDAAVGELLGSPVVPGVELEDVLGQVVAERRRRRSLVGARRDDHGAGGQRVAGRLDAEAVAVPGDVRHLDALPDGRGEALCVRLEVADHLCARREGLGLGPCVREAGQVQRPVRRVEDEAVPPLGAPRLADPATLQHDVRDPSLGEVVARRQSRLAGADHDRVDRLHRCLRSAGVGNLIWRDAAAQRNEPPTRTSGAAGRPVRA
jgi:hypothetical protein